LFELNHQLQVQATEWAIL